MKSIGLLIVVVLLAAIIGTGCQCHTNKCRDQNCNKIEFTSSSGIDGSAQDDYLSSWTLTQAREDKGQYDQGHGF